MLVEKQFNLDSDVLFEFNKATLKPEASQALDNLFAQILAANPKDGVATVIGHHRPHRLRGLQPVPLRAAGPYRGGLSHRQGAVCRQGARRGAGESSPVTGQLPDGAKAQMIACLAPDRRVEVRLTGVSPGRRISHLCLALKQRGVLAPRCILTPPHPQPFSPARGEGSRDVGSISEA